MRLWLFGLMFFTCALHSRAQDAVGVPLEEYKALFRESITRELRADPPPPPLPRKPQVHAIDSATYRLQLGATTASGELELTGRILEGDPTPIDLFGSELIMAGTGELSGATLLTATDITERIQLLPQTGATSFTVRVPFLCAISEDQRSRLVRFAIPPALQNAVQVTVPDGTRLLEVPGLADAQGLHRFAPAHELLVRFADPTTSTTAAPPEVDTLTRIELQGRRVVLTLHAVPRPPLAAPLVLHAPAGMALGSTSLKPSWIGRGAAGRYEIRLPEDDPQPFTIQFIGDAITTAGLGVELPRIDANVGREGAFILAQPEEGELSIHADQPPAISPVRMLDPALIEAAGRATQFQRVAAATPLQLGFKPFQTVTAPPVVLDEQYFFTAFEENGSVMSVLVMQVPPDAGARLSLRAVPGAEVWSLKVNGQPRKLSNPDGQTWLIPLDEGEPSQVELALLRPGSKLGLEGRLETLLPATGLAARSLRVGIALPPRVQLVALEGPVSPATGQTWNLPKDFVGQPYLFTRAFHRGEAVPLAVFYKEPLDRK